MEQEGLELVHVLLDCDEQALRERIAADQVDVGAAGWRLRHLERYLDARAWMRACADVVVDVSDRSPDAAGAEVVAALR